MFLFWHDRQLSESWNVLGFHELGLFRQVPWSNYDWKKKVKSSGHRLQCRIVLAGSSLYFSASSSIKLQLRPEKKGKNLFPARTEKWHNSTTGKKAPPAHAQQVYPFLRPSFCPSVRVKRGGNGVKECLWEQTLIFLSACIGGILRLFTNFYLHRKFSIFLRNDHDWKIVDPYKARKRYTVTESLDLIVSVKKRNPIRIFLN